MVEQQEGTQQEVPVAEKPPVVNSSKNKRKLFAIISLILVGFFLIGSLLLVFTQSKNTNEQTVKNCSDKSEGSILLRSQQALIGTAKDPSFSELQKITDEIKTISSYDKDPNCLYPIARYHFLKNEIDQAKQNLDLLEAAYGNGDSFAKDVFQIENIDSLKSSVNFAYESKDTPNTEQATFMPVPADLKDPRTQ